MASFPSAHPLNVGISIFRVKCHLSAMRLLRLSVRIAPGRGWLPRGLVQGPEREGEAGGEVLEDHADPAADADPGDQLGRGEVALGRREVAGDPQRVVLAGLAALGVELDDQDQVGQVVSERRLDGVVDLGVAVHGSLARNGGPDRLGMAAPGAAGGRRVAQQVAGGAALQVEVVRRAVSEIGEVLVIERLDPEAHAEIVAVDGHGFAGSGQGAAQPAGRGAASASAAIASSRISASTSRLSATKRGAVSTSGPRGRGMSTTISCLIRPGRAVIT